MHVPTSGMQALSASASVRFPGPTPHSAGACLTYGCTSGI